MVLGMRMVSPWPLGSPRVTVADPPFTRSTIVTAQLVLSTDPPHMIARIAWNASGTRVVLRFRRSSGH